MKGLDTNVVVRYLTQDDPRQSRRANAVIENALAGEGRLHVDTVVLCEVVWVLGAAYQLDRATVAGTLLQLVDAAQLSLDDRDLLREAAQRYQTGPGDFADYVLGLRNRAAGCETTLTFDRAHKRDELFTLL
jgi:predicted nucleic-acid-binding protein